MTEITSNTPKKESYLQSVIKICTNKNFLIMMLIRALYAVSNDLSKTTINRFGKSLGVSVAVLGFVAGFSSVCKMLGRPMAGRITDKLPGKRGVTIAFILMAVCYAFYAVTANTTTFVISQMLYAFGGVMCMCGMSAVTAGTVDKRVLGTAMGVYTFMPKAVGSLAPLISVYMYDVLGQKAPFILSCALCVVTIIIAQFLDVDEDKVRAKAQANVKKEEEKRATRAGGFKLSNYISFPSLPVVGIRFFTSFMFTLISTYLVIYGDEKGIAGIAIYSTMYSLCSMWGGIVGGPLYDRFGLDVVFYPSLVASIIAPLLISYAPNAIWVAAAGILFGFTYGMTNPATSAAGYRMVTPEHRGICSATNLLVPDVCSVVVGFIAGLIVEPLGIGKTFAVFTIFPMIGLVVYTLSRRWIKNHMLTVQAALEAGKSA